MLAVMQVALQLERTSLAQVQNGLIFLQAMMGLEALEVAAAQDIGVIADTINPCMLVMEHMVRMV